MWQMHAVLVVSAYGLDARRALWTFAKGRKGALALPVWHVIRQARLFSYNPLGKLTE
jgi:hypothetical protein